MVTITYKCNLKLCTFVIINGIDFLAYHDQIKVCVRKCHHFPPSSLSLKFSHIIFFLTTHRIICIQTWQNFNFLTFYKKVYDFRFIQKFQLKLKKIFLINHNVLFVDQKTKMGATRGQCFNIGLY